jgi:hypothetical protein
LLIGHQTKLLIETLFHKNMLEHERGAADCGELRETAEAIAEGLVLKRTSMGDRSRALPDMPRRDFKYDSERNEHCGDLDKSVCRSGLHIHC